MKKTSASIKFAQGLRNAGVSQVFIPRSLSLLLVTAMVGRMLKMVKTIDIVLPWETIRPIKLIIIYPIAPSGHASTKTHH